MKLVCENVMLNLLIGMILDNFSYVTDEVAHVPDEEWSQGASDAQVPIHPPSPLHLSSSPSISSCPVTINSSSALSSNSCFDVWIPWR